VTEVKGLFNFAAGCVGYARTNQKLGASKVEVSERPMTFNLVKPPATNLSTRLQHC
jgi:hypothetical protein